MNVVRLALACIAMVVGAGACAQSMYRGDAAHTGSYGGDGPREFHRVKWKFTTGDRIVASPVHKAGVIYFGSDDGNIYAVDAADGRQRWKRNTDGPVPATPAIDGDTLFVGSYDGRFYALDARTGALRWKFTTGGERRFEVDDLDPRGIVGEQIDPALARFAQQVRRVEGEVPPGAQEFAAAPEELMIIGPQIIRIGPRPRLPGPAIEIQRVFGVNPVAQIDAVIAVLRRRQDQLGLG